MIITGLNVCMCSLGRMWEKFFSATNFLPPAAAHAVLGADSINSTIGLHHSEQTPAAQTIPFGKCLLVGDIGCNWLGDSLSEQGAKSCNGPHNDCGTCFELEPNGDPFNLDFTGVIKGGVSIAGYADDGESNHDDR